MKKRILLCTFLVHATAANALSDVSSKYYIETAIGTSSMNSKGRLWNNRGAPGGDYADVPILPNATQGTTFAWDLGTGPANSTPGSPGFMGSVSIGYDCRLPKSIFLCGAFFGGGGTGAHCSFPYGGNKAHWSGNAFLPRYQTTRSAVYISDGGFFALGGRFGLAMGPALAFFRVGWAPHRVQAKIQRMGTVANVAGTTYSAQLQRTVMSSWINTLLLGIGIDVNLTKNLILGLLFEGHIGAKRGYLFPTGILTSKNGYSYDTPAVQIKPLFTQYLLTFKYAIPTCK